MFASTASEIPVKTKSESHKVPLSSLNEQQTRTGRPVICASSSNSSEWNTDDKWSSQVWKSGEMLGARNTSIEENRPASFLDHVYFGCTQRECKTSKDILNIIRICSNHEFLMEELRNCQVGRNLTRIQSLGLVIWKVTRRNLWKGVANWQTKQQSSFTKSPLHTWTTINSRRKNRDQ